MRIQDMTKQTKTEERTEERRNRFNGESIMLTRETRPYEENT